MTLMLTYKIIINLQFEMKIGKKTIEAVNYCKKVEKCRKRL